MSGNSVQCRIYHAGDPAAVDPATHCPHASPDGGGVCPDPKPLTWCESTCAAMFVGCPDAMEGTEADCVDGCESNAKGDCAEEWAAFQTCVPGDAKWACD